MYYYRVYISNVLRLETSQQCNETEYTSAVFSDWEQLSNVIRQGIPQNVLRFGKTHQCLKIGSYSAM